MKIFFFKADLDFFAFEVAELVFFCLFQCCQFSAVKIQMDQQVRVGQFGIVNDSFDAVSSKMEVDRSDADSKFSFV